MSVVYGNVAVSNPGTAGIVTLVNAANPPLRMPFGSDTVAVIEEQNASVAKELAEWRDLALSTDFAKDAAA